MPKTKHRSARPPQPQPQPQPQENKSIAAKVAPSPAPAVEIKTNSNDPMQDTAAQTTAANAFMRPAQSPSAVKDAVARLQTPRSGAAALHRRQTRRDAGPCGASS
jgi:hypothetical protein